MRPAVLIDGRETPLNDIHLENMLALSRIGAVIFPPMPAFYHNPETIDDLIEQTSARVLELFGLEPSGLRRWTGMREGATSAVVRPLAIHKGESR